MSDYDTLAVICKDPKDVDKLMEKHGDEYKVDRYVYISIKDAIFNVEDQARTYIKRYEYELSKLEDKTSSEAQSLLEDIDLMNEYLKWSDEKKLQKYLQGMGINLYEDNGNLLTDYNKDARWIEYEVLDEEPVKVKDIDKSNFITDAILLPDGTWYDNREPYFIGRFANDKTRKKFKEEYFNILDTDKYADCYCVLVKFEAKFA